MIFRALTYPATQRRSLECKIIFYFIFVKSFQVFSDQIYHSTTYSTLFYTYANVIEYGSSSYGLLFPVSFISNSKLTFFGGRYQYSSSIQQTIGASTATNLIYTLGKILPRHLREVGPTCYGCPCRPPGIFHQRPFPSERTSGR